MKKQTKEKNEEKYDIDMEAFTLQMTKNDDKNWILSEGVNMVLKNKKVGKNMLTFLKIMNVLKPVKKK